MVSNMPTLPNPHWAYVLYFGTDDNGKCVPRGTLGYAQAEYFYTRVEAITYAVSCDMIDYDLELTDLEAST